MNKKVLLFLPQGFELYEASVFTDVFGWSRLSGVTGVDLDTVSFEREVRCNWNLIVKSEFLYEDIDPDSYDALAIPGGFKRSGYYNDVYDKRLLDLIVGFDRSHKYIAAVCTASLCLAKAGVLNGRSAVTYGLLNGYFQSQLAGSGAFVEHQPLFVENNIITCCGPGAAADCAFKLLSCLTDEDNMNKIKDMMRF